MSTFYQMCFYSNSTIKGGGGAHKYVFELEKNPFAPFIHLTFNAEYSSELNKLSKYAPPTNQNPSTPLKRTKKAKLPLPCITIELKGSDPAAFLNTKNEEGITKNYSYPLFSAFTMFFQRNTHLFISKEALEYVKETQIVNMKKNEA